VDNYTVKITIRGDGGRNDAIYLRAVWQNSKPNITALSTEIDKSMSALRISEEKYNRMCFLLGHTLMARLAKEKYNANVSYSVLKAGGDIVEDMEAKEKQIAKMKKAVAKGWMTQEEADKKIKEAGFNPDDYTNTSYLAALPKTKLIEKWYIDNIKYEKPVKEVKEEMIEAGIIDDTNEDWSLAKNVASTCGVSSGGVRGMWSPPI